MSAQHTPGPNWIVDGKDGSAILIFDENSPDDRESIKVYGRHQEELARSIATLLNDRRPTVAAVLVQVTAFTYTVERFVRAGDGSDPRVPPTESEVADALYALRAAIAKAGGAS